MKNVKKKGDRRTRSWFIGNFGKRMGLGDVGVSCPKETKKKRRHRV